MAQNHVPRFQETRPTNRFMNKTDPLYSLIRWCRANTWKRGKL